MYEKRIARPMVRESKEESFEEVSWERAYEFVHERVKDLDGREVLFIPSGKTTNEDCYVMQKFARIALRTNNVDGCCSRLCHANTVRAIKDSFGIDGSPSRFDDIYTRDLVLVVGSNPASNHPVLFNKMMRARARGTKLVCVVSTPNETSKVSDLAVQVQPDTEVALINALTNSVIRRGGLSERAINTNGFGQLVSTVSEYTCERVCPTCGIETELFRKLEEAVCSSKAFGLMHGMGLTQSKNGLLNVYALLNLVIVKDGKILSNRGEVNVQGVGDMGGNPTGIISSFIMKDELERAWGSRLTSEMGLNMIQSLYLSPVKAVFACDVNLAVSLPDLDRLHGNLSNMFLVLLHHHENLTAKFANVLLPIPMLVERLGTITNGERRVRLVRKVAEPVGEAKPAWVIFKELSKRFGVGRCFEYGSEKEVFDEICRLIPSYRSVNADEVYGGQDGWALKDPPFTKYVPVHYEGREYARTGARPYVLVTVRSPSHFLHGELTSLSPTLRRGKEGQEESCYMNPEDAEEKGLRDGDLVAVRSVCGSVGARLRVDPSVNRGLVKMFIHSEKLLVNRLVPLDYTSLTFTPNYKSISVDVRKA
ncbi:MAG: molybdopterin-dependent oxidoreductase [Thermoproteota archaeon]